jgi:hypothetical protein
LRSELSFFIYFWPDHAEKLHQLPDEYLTDILPIAKKIAVAQGAENYNILQVGTAFPVNPPSSTLFFFFGTYDLWFHDVE